MIFDRTLIFSNSKGGSGKSSVTSSLAVLYAATGRRVLVIDTDPQAGFGDDLGYQNEKRPTTAHLTLGLVHNIDFDSDQGESLYDALSSNAPLRIQQNVRKNLDVVPGGSFLKEIGPHTAAYWERKGKRLNTRLRELLTEYEDTYDLVLVDTPPGEQIIQHLALCSGRFAVIVTKSDLSSIKGLGRLGQETLAVGADNPDLDLLGVVMFAVGQSSSVVRRETREDLEELLDGYAPVFHTVIRQVEAAARAARKMGVTPGEYELYVRERSDRSRVESAPKLAQDYEELFMEIDQAHAAKIRGGAL